MQITNGRLGETAQLIELLVPIFEELDLPLVQAVGMAPVLKAVTDDALAATKVTNGAEFTRYHPANALVARDDNEQVLGTVFAYPGSWEKQLDRSLNELLQQRFATEDEIFNLNETVTGEFYIDSIVVADIASGQGVGRQLLQAAIKRGLDQNLIPALNVAELNPRAHKLYEHIGFVVTDECEISNHHYYHMQYCGK